MTQITDEDVIALTQPSQDIPPLQLESLMLDMCFSLTDESLKHLKNLPLTELTLRGCGEDVGFTDEGLGELRGLQLTNLDLAFNEMITDGGLAVLRG